VVTAVTRSEAERLCEELSVLAEPHRLLVLRHLRRGARSAGFLAQAVGMPPSLASHHLAVLADAGLVTRRRKGHFICYAANRQAVKELHQRLGRLAGASGMAAESLSPTADDPC
jgi:DNA-binding transcriptional ArsR family regulator